MGITFPSVGAAKQTCILLLQPPVDVSESGSTDETKSTEKVGFLRFLFACFVERKFGELTFLFLSVLSSSFYFIHKIVHPSLSLFLAFSSP